MLFGRLIITPGAHRKGFGAAGKDTYRVNKNDVKKPTRGEQGRRNKGRSRVRSTVTGEDPRPLAPEDCTLDSFLPRSQPFSEVISPGETISRTDGEGLLCAGWGGSPALSLAPHSCPESPSDPQALGSRVGTPPSWSPVSLIHSRRARLPPKPCRDRGKRTWAAWVLTGPTARPHGVLMPTSPTQHQTRRRGAYGVTAQGSNPRLSEGLC